MHTNCLHHLAEIPVLDVHFHPHLYHFAMRGWSLPKRCKLNVRVASQELGMSLALRNAGRETLCERMGVA